MNNSTTTIFENISKVGVITPTTLNGLPGMSSLEIAKITGKNHKHVLRDISKMLKALEFRSPDLGRQFVQTNYQDVRGKFQPMGVLDKELTFTLLSHYSFDLSNLIVKRWLELEGSNFTRVSVQEAVVQLVEREKDNRQAALRLLKKRPRRSLSPAQQEQQRLFRVAQRIDRERGIF
ncbi:Rha family transcriptional regulator [Pseudomonas sp. NFX98]|uniref:Rha family transcriptional regulator n=1 Tax=Pseudomonas sp. NFX98 TaxID=3399122 RepID=UPI0039FBEB31